jgi:hypothetical protein
MGEKGLVEEDWNDRQLEEEDNTINKWAQKEMYSLLNNYNNNPSKALVIFIVVYNMFCQVRE